jgi:hypothetical protein
VSFAERMRLVSVPRGTTLNWLRFLLHYGHTLSGKLTVKDGENAVLKAIAERTGLGLELSQIAERRAPNARWFVHYTKGVMDTDSLSDLVFGELYIPLSITAGGQIRTAKTWRYAAAMREVVAEYACRFDKPFWAPDASVGEGKREFKLADGTVLSESLNGTEQHGYGYEGSGLDGVTGYSGSFRVSEPSDDQVTLTWSVELSSEDPAAIVRALGIIGLAASAMTSAMSAYFAPRD